MVYALAQVNVLLDRSQTPHLPADRLSELLGVKKTTMANKGKLARDTVGMSPFDPEYLRRDLVDLNALTWLLKLDNGLIVDARQLPLALQVEAHRRGLIPYVPGLEGQGNR